jgi:hypothetical protein
MSLLRFIEDVIRLVVLAFLDLRRAGVRLVLFLALAVELLILLILSNPTFPLWNGPVVLLVERVFGSFYLHYPQSYVGLPTTGSAGKLLVDLVLTPFVAAWCGYAVLEVVGERYGKRMLSLCRKAYLPLLLLTVLEIGIWILFYGLPVYFIDRQLHLGYRLHSMITIFGSLLPLVLLAPFFFVLPHLLRERKGLPAAISSSFARARRSPSWPLAFVLVPWLASLPLSLVLQRSARLSAQLRPEMVLVVIGLQALIFLVFAFVTVDASVRLYLRPRGRGL